MLPGLAAQFGLTLPTSDGGQSPAFYADLLTSHEILGALVDTRFEHPSDTGMVRGTLVDIHRPGSPDPRCAVDTIRHLAKHVDASTARRPAH
jgi:hypothetical protein